MLKRSRRVLNDAKEASADVPQEVNLLGEWWAEGMSEEDVMRSLKAVVDSA